MPTIASASWNRGKKLPPEVLTREEAKALLTASSARAPTGLRNRALIVLLWRGCLRLDEALNLRPKDLDATTGDVRVLHGKGDKARTTVLDAEAFAVIERWMAMRAERVKSLKRNSPVICTLEGAPVNASYVPTLMKRLAARAGISKRVHPHALRHTGAAELAAEGKPVNMIQALLGHASLATTDRYLSHIAPEQLRKTMRSRPPWEEDHSAEPCVDLQGALADLSRDEFVSIIRDAASRASTV